MMSKRIISLLLALLMLAGLLSVSAMAASGEAEAAALEADVPVTLDAASDGEGEVTPDTDGEDTEPSANTGTLTVTTSPTSVEVGETFTVTISVTAEQVPALALSYSYDESLLEYVSGTFSDTVRGTSILNNIRDDRCSWTAGWLGSGFAAMDLNGVFLTLTFKALQSTDTAEITISAAGGTSLDVISSNPTITFASRTVSMSIIEDDASSAETGVLGDVSGDGKIRANDARLILDYLLGNLGENVTFDLSVCDCDGNGTLRANDARLILDYLLGKSNGVGKEVVITDTHESGVGIWEFKQ